MENNGHSTKKFEEALHLLNEAAREKKEEIQSLIGGKYSELRDVLDDTKTQGRKAYRRAKNTAEDWIGENTEGLRETVEELDEKVHENPWAYLGGVAVGALLLGFILDLLQEIGKEIGKRVQAQMDKAWGKVADAAYQGTLGLLKQYQEKTLQLVRIQAALFYAQALKVARKHLLLLCVLLFGTMVSAIALVVIPVSLVLLTPWSIAIKTVCLLVLGSTYIAGTAWIFLVLFSEDKWMKYSGVQELLDRISAEDSRF